MSEGQPRELGKALRRGAAGLCPKCGEGRLFDGFLSLHTACDHCGFGIHRHAPAAGPAFLSAAIASLFVVPILALTAAITGPHPAVLAGVALAILPLLSVLLLRAIKGAMVGYLWAYDVVSDPGNRV